MLLSQLTAPERKFDEGRDHGRLAGHHFPRASLNNWLPVGIEQITNKVIKECLRTPTHFYVILALPPSGSLP